MARLKMDSKKEPDAKKFSEGVDSRDKRETLEYCKLQ